MQGSGSHLLLISGQVGVGRLPKERPNANWLVGQVDIDAGRVHACGGNSWVGSRFKQAFSEGVHSVLATADV